MSRDALRVSPQQIDPLSWVTGSGITLAFSAGALLIGLITTLLTWGLSERPYLDLIGVAAITGACLFVHVLTRPMRPPFGLTRALPPLALALVGLAFSTWASTTSTVPVHNWWIPIGLGLLIASCAPFSTVPAILGYGTVTAVGVGVATAVGFTGRNDPWSDFSSVFIACSTVIQATTAASVFAYLVVRRTQRLLSGAGTPVDESDEAREDAARKAHITMVARLGTRVAPFLDAVASAGVVTSADRALAGQLARRLRTALVSQANRTWLDSMAAENHIHVVDPERRAGSMNMAQRAALRGLVLAVVNHPATDSDSLFIELRSQNDGSTAVALSLDLDLPEGRRIMMLAPYYVTLETTVDEMSWDPVLELLRFTVPPGRNW